MKSSRVHNPSTTILFVEETARTIDDGYFSVVGFNAYPLTSGGQQDMSQVYPGNTGKNWLAVSHDNKVHRPDDLIVTALGETNIPNPNGRGNVAFCDGHAEFVTRAYIATPALRHWDPSF
jgi:prepilin-type processing-associated H-X9-DG protein